MTMLLRLGKPTHMRVACRTKAGKEIKKITLTACGLVGSHLDVAYDARDVDCTNCMRTLDYKAYMGMRK